MARSPWWHLRKVDGSGGRTTVVFVFFSNRLGCLTSLVISVVVTALLILLLRP